MAIDDNSSSFFHSDRDPLTRSNMGAILAPSRICYTDRFVAICQKVDMPTLTAWYYDCSLKKASGKRTI